MTITIIVAAHYRQAVQIATLRRIPPGARHWCADDAIADGLVARTKARKAVRFERVRVGGWRIELPKEAA